VIQAGSKLAHYEVVSALGKGGMGEVWRAKDTKLGREVAIKTLPEEFAQDADRLARFEREAKLLASLNHPNIASIFGFEEDNGTHFLVMELVEGDTLADRVGRGAIPAEESLKLALQIAEALEAAHEKGVIHRDLKPANIKVTPDGKVKVLDFGLAKAFAGDQQEASPANSPTLSMQATQQGVILGTASYMSPEQAKGHRADERADVWALGAVLYEMLTGLQAFGGGEVSEILASVLARDPDYSQLEVVSGLQIQRIIRRCLEKEPKQRWRSAGDVRFGIEDALVDLAGVETPATRAPTSSARAGWIAAAAVLGALVASGAIWGLRPSPASLPVQFTIPLPGFSLYDAVTGNGLTAVDVSPDGQSLVYVADNRLYRRSLAESEPEVVPGTIDSSMPLFSRDGQSLFFLSATGVLQQSSFAGGSPEDLLERTDMRGASLRGDDEIVFGTGTSGLWIVSVAGGEPRELTRIARDSLNHRWPDVLPGGGAALFNIQEGLPESGVGGTPEIAIVDLETGDVEPLGLLGAHPQYVPTGHIVFVRDETLWAVPFDADRLEVTGDDRPTGIEDVSVTGENAHFSVNGGTLAYVSGLRNIFDQRGTLMWVDRDGNEDPLPFEIGRFGALRLSSDNRLLATVTEGDGGSLRESIQIGDLERGDWTRVTDSDQSSELALWTPEADLYYTGVRSDGEVVLLWSDAEGEQVVSVEGSPGHRHLNDITADGDILAWHVTGGLVGEMTSWTAEVSDNLMPQPFLDEGVSSVVFSPDAQWVAYVSYESVGPRVYATSYPEPGRIVSVSTGRGTAPLWSADGNEIFYRDGDQMMAARIESGESLAVELPTPLFDDDYVPTVGPAGGRNYDVSDDGQRFLMMKPVDTTPEGDALPAPQLHVIVNWDRVLASVVPVP
jgi:serine/threonine protein kinase